MVPTTKGITEFITSVLLASNLKLRIDRCWSYRRILVWMKSRFERNQYKGSVLVSKHFSTSNLLTTHKT